MKLTAGLIAQSPAWEELLSQEGLPWKLLPRHEEWFDLCSILVITRQLEGTDKELAARFLQRGGAILGSAKHFGGLCHMSTRPTRLRYILSEGDPVFKPVQLIDLGMRGDIPREANRLRTDMYEQAVFAGELGGGVGVALPFDVQRAMCDVRTTAKAFYCRRDRLPSERVSLVARGEIRHLIRSALVWLHHMRGLPYTHLWYYPGRSHSVASFRIDTDGAPREDIDALYGILHDAGVPGNWFLDVWAHEKWLPHFHSLEGQEIGLHCYAHRFGNDIKADKVNVRRGYALLREAGWNVPGFAAPYGIWTPAYGAFIDSMGFSYSSEFSAGYDTLPFWPIHQEGRSSTLQIPIHPVSIGSLRRVGATSEEMVRYFTETASDLLTRQLPLIFYHHPTHRRWDVVQAMMNSYRKVGVRTLTMNEYARWWQQRALLEVDIDIAGNRVVVTNGDLAHAADVFLHIIRPDGCEAIASPAEPISMSDLRFDVPRPVTVPADLRRIRDIDPRRLLGDLYSSMLRRLK
jgi:hypothetical protein